MILPRPAPRRPETLLLPTDLLELPEPAPAATSSLHFKGPGKPSPAHTSVGLPSVQSCVRQTPRTCLLPDTSSDCRPATSMRGLPQGPAVLPATSWSSSA